MFRVRFAMALVAGLALCQTASAVFIININPGTELSGNAAALAAFNRAAAQLTSQFSDNITVNIAADLADLGNPLIIGQASSVGLSTPDFNSVRDAMAADATGGDPSDDIAVSLPTAAQFGAFLPAGFGINAIGANKANLKALGFAGLDTTFGPNDATITFNSTFAFDFDNSNGVTPGLVDFETVAAHEIIHALGFVSVVDQIDFLVSQAMTANVAVRALDLFRFGPTPGHNPSDANSFTNAGRDLRPNVAAYFDDSVTEFRMATGAFTGDGDQASHWLDDNGVAANNIGIMDPTLASGIVSPIKFPDIHALDLIGYDLVVGVPEPSSFVFGAIAAVGMAGIYWRRRRAASKADPVAE